MNRKGFTLTELLVVIALIGVLSIIVIPSIMSVRGNINERLYDEKIGYIVAAAELYGNNNPDIFNGSDVAIIKVYNLLDEEYLEVDQKDSGACFILDVDGNQSLDGTASGLGCMINPINNESMNNVSVTLTKKTVGVVATIGEPENDSETSSTLVSKVCKGFSNGAFSGKYGTGDNDYCGCDSYVNPTKLVATGGSKNGQEVDVCLIVSNNSNGSVDNWLKYGSTKANWRVLGIYKVSGELLPKMITAEPVEN